MAALEISRRDLGRLLALVKEKRRKLKRGLDKFGDDFDEVRGANLKGGYIAFVALEHQLTEVFDADHPRRAGRNTAKREARD